MAGSARNWMSFPKHEHDVHNLSHRNTSKVPWSTLSDIGGSFSILVEVITLIVNLLPIIVVIVTRKSFRTRTTLEDLIVVLSVFYIFYMILPSPLAHISYFKKEWYGGNLSCKIYQIVVNSLRMCSLSIISILSIDRSLSVYYFLMRKEYSNSYRAKCKILMVILLQFAAALLISCTPILGLGPKSMKNSFCLSWISQIPEHPRELVFIVMYISHGSFNLLCICIANAFSICYKKKIKSQIYKPSTRESDFGDIRTQIEGERVLVGVRLSLCVSFLVLVTWTPALVLVTLRISGYGIGKPPVTYALLSTSVSALVDPILYGLCDIHFRKNYQRLFQALCYFRKLPTGQTIPKSASGTDTLSPETVPRASTSGCMSTIGFVNSAFENTQQNDSSLFGSFDNIGQCQEDHEIRHDNQMNENTKLISEETDGRKLTDSPSESSSSAALSDDDLYEKISSMDDESDEDNEELVHESVM